ncbi:major facilitator superfamily domain-containing protein 6-like [Tubulanus polymorphus]|uniref:major facilitator superfamily domain-containing protein 6-like n=1 Tax=Tubulanus polymorphus TaxID=672921 RepID=UPI003DA695C4
MVRVDSITKPDKPDYQGYSPDKEKTITINGNMNQPPPKPGGRNLKRDILDGLFTYVNYDLFLCKAFYFFFFSAFGSLFPLMGVYFKQIGMNASQTGVLIGFRPFIEFCSVPFWGTVANRFRKAKWMLLLSLACWIIFTLALAFIKPPPYTCRVEHNDTHDIFEDARYKRDLSALYKRESTLLNNVGAEIDPGLVGSQWHSGDVSKHIRTKRMTATRTKTKGPFGQSPYAVDHNDIANKDDVDVAGLVEPGFSSIIYKAKAIAETFLLILLIIVIGEFFSSPALTLADSATLIYLEDDLELYGKQRMFGSFGWAIAMFFTGIALDHATSFPDHPCDHIEIGEKNYTICFAVFTVFMSLAWLTATQFKFKHDAPGESIPLAKITHTIKKKVTDTIAGRPAWPKTKFFNQGGGDSDEEIWNPSYQNEDNQQGNMGYQSKVAGQPEINPNIAKDGQNPIIETDANHPKPLKITMNADPDAIQNTAVSDAVKGLPHTKDSLPNWITVMKLFANIRHGFTLYCIWFMGFGIGIVFAFLFWHLQDLGGGPTLFGIASIINHISEIVAFVFGKRLITKVGPTKVICLGLAGNVCRFLYISYLSNPWWVLPFEFVQGLTHAAVWSAVCSFVNQAIPSTLRPSAQGIVQCIHHALGRGCGAIFGGVFISNFGSEMTFRGYGYASLIIFAIYVLIIVFIKEPVLPESDTVDAEVDTMQETAHLEPCGVPMNPMSRNLSSQRLAEMDQPRGNGYGTTKGPDGLLSPTGAAQPPVKSNLVKPTMVAPTRGPREEADKTTFAPLPGGGYGGGRGGYGQQAAPTGPTDHASRVAALTSHQRNASGHYDPQFVQDYMNVQRDQDNQRQQQQQGDNKDYRNPFHY